MRDPQGSITLAGEEVVRRLYAPLPSEHFLHSALAARWVEAGQLVPFEFRDPSTVVSPRLPFVTQPPEWCDSQFFDAAKLTLALAESALEDGFELKDGSAWNVIFDGCRPVFCDHLSLTPIEGRLWWAGGQFARHFVVPLLLSQRRGIKAHELLRSWRDGVPPEIARRMLGAARFLTRSWPLIAGGQPSDASKAGVAASTKYDPAKDAGFRRRLHTSMGWMLDSVAPKEHKVPSVWRGYVDERPQYPGDSLEAKARCVGEWLGTCQPRWVADLGCNTGEFSRMAADAGARVLALDGDHDSIDRLYRAHRDDHRIHPLVTPLDDLQGGRGWMGREHPGLPQRADQAFDVVMMLALVHHLAIAASLPMRQVAELAARWSRRHVIVELIHPDDPQVQLLCSQRRRDPTEYSLASQLAAFADAGFEVSERRELAPAARTMVLLTKRP